MNKVKAGLGFDLTVAVFLIILGILFLSAAKASPGAILSGRVVDGEQQPVDGCRVSLSRAGVQDITQNGVFEFRNLPGGVQWIGPESQGPGLKGNRLHFLSNGSQPVSINIFDLTGRHVLNVINTRLPQGEYSFDPLAYVPSPVSRSMHLVSVNTSGKTSVYKIPMVEGAGRSKGIVPSGRLGVSEMDIADTATVRCDGYHKEKVEVTNYHGSLGNIAVSLLMGGRSQEKFDEIIYVTRKSIFAHWYDNFAYWHHSTGHKSYQQGGQLVRLNLGTGVTTLLLGDPEGTIRDPVVSYEGDKILFSYRPGDEVTFHLYEVNIDGTGLKQLTFGKYDDIEPIYLPDGDIMFVSGRAMRWVPCFLTQVAVLHRMEADGSNIRKVSGNVEHDNTPWLMADGRIMYTRWDYIDRSQMHFHHLWVMNPNGTGQMTLYGNMHPDDVFIDAKPLPGDPSRLIMINSPGHGNEEHKGRVTILDLTRGPDDLSAQTMISGDGFKDPYPFSGSEMLVTNGSQLFIMDLQGNTELLYELPGGQAGEGYEIMEPRPLRARTRESIIPDKTDWNKATGNLAVMDVHIGRNMGGVEPGTIKKLLIMEALPKPINQNDTREMQPVTWGGAFNITRVLGTVPVESDGSANFDVPANRALIFAALDKNDLAVKRMVSFHSVMPGEVNHCTGCHENRTDVVPNLGTRMALQRPPSQIKPIPGVPEIFDYDNDIQPILDNHCVSCHGVDQYAGSILLTGDQGPIYTHSYFVLQSRLQMADGRNLARGNYAPYKSFSGASDLIKKASGGHQGVKVSDAEILKLKTWIDASANFCNTYACMGTGVVRKDGGEEVVNRRCASCHNGDMTLPTAMGETIKSWTPGAPSYGEDRGPYGRSHFWTPPWVEPYGDGSLAVGSREWMKKYAHPLVLYSQNFLYNLSRPEKSVMLLAPLAKSAGGYEKCGPVFANTDDPDYQALLGKIKEGQAELERIGRFNQPNFIPSNIYIREMKRYGVLAESFNPGDPIDVLEVEEAYFRLGWHVPEGGVTGIKH